MSWYSLKPQKKHLLIAFAFAGEWALAFAFAKRFANAIADANYELAIADARAEYPPRVRELERRVSELELAHGRAPSSLDDHGREDSTTLD